MKTFFAVAFLVVAAGLTGWFVSEEMHSQPVPVESERHYIYGFGPHGSNRPFGDYLEEVTVEGLREIRWDHKHYGDPRFAGASNGYLASNSTVALYATAVSTSATYTTCSVQPATVWTTQYLR